MADTDTTSGSGSTTTTSKTGSSSTAAQAATPAASPDLSTMSDADLKAEMERRRQADIATMAAANLVLFAPVADVMKTDTPTAITVSDLITLLQSQMATGTVYGPATAFFVHANAALAGLKQLQTLTNGSVGAINATGKTPTATQ